MEHGLVRECGACDSFDSAPGGPDPARLAAARPAAGLEAAAAAEVEWVQSMLRSKSCDEGGGRSHAIFGPSGTGTGNLPRAAEGDPAGRGDLRAVPVHRRG